MNFSHNYEFIVNFIEIKVVLILIKEVQLTTSRKVQHSAELTT